MCIEKCSRVHCGLFVGCSQCLNSWTNVHYAPVIKHVSYLLMMWVSCCQMWQDAQTCTCVCIGPYTYPYRSSSSWLILQTHLQLSVSHIVPWAASSTRLTPSRGKITQPMKNIENRKITSIVQTCEDNVCVTWSPLLLKCPKMAPFFKTAGPKAQTEWLLAGSFQTLRHSLKSIQQILHFPLQKPWKFHIERSKVEWSLESSGASG